MIDFIFGNTIVVRTAREAYNLSVKGYRSVSIDGEFFEPKSKILLVDYNSAVVDFVTEINLKNDIESLRVLIMNLKNSLFKKTTELRNLLDKLKKLQSEKIGLKIIKKYLEDKVIFQINVLKENGTELKDLKILQSKNESDYKNSITLQETVKKRFFLRKTTKKKLEKNPKIIKLRILEQTKIADSNLERSKYEVILKSDNQELQNIIIKFSEKKNERDLLLERINMIHEERNILTKRKN